MPRGRGRQPRAVRAARTLSARASRSNAHPRAQGGLVHAPRRTVWGKEQLLRVVCRDRREIFVGAGGCHGPRGGSEPSRRAHRARGAYVPGEGGGNYVTDAARGSRSCRTRSCRARRGIPLAVCGSHGPYGRPAHSRRALALMIGPQGVGGRPAGAPRGARRGAVSVSREYPVLGAGSSWAREAATGHAGQPHPSSVHVALASGHGWVGLRHGHPVAHREEHAVMQRGASRGLSMRDVGSSCA